MRPCAAGVGVNSCAATPQTCAMDILAMLEHWQDAHGTNLRAMAIPIHVFLPSGQRHGALP